MITYEPAYVRSPTILKLVAEISESIGRYTTASEQSLTPQLRRANRIRSIQASLEIREQKMTWEELSRAKNR